MFTLPARLSRWLHHDLPGRLSTSSTCRSPTWWSRTSEPAPVDANRAEHAADRTPFRSGRLVVPTSGPGGVRDLTAATGTVRAPPSLPSMSLIEHTEKRCQHDVPPDHSPRRGRPPEPRRVPAHQSPHRARPGQRTGRASTRPSPPGAPPGSASEPDPPACPPGRARPQPAPLDDAVAGSCSSGASTAPSSPEPARGIALPAAGHVARWRMEIRRVTADGAQLYSADQLTSLPAGDGLLWVDVPVWDAAAAAVLTEVRHPPARRGTAPTATPCPRCTCIPATCSSCCTRPSSGAPATCTTSSSTSSSGRLAGHRARAAQPGRRPRGRDASRRSRAARGSSPAGCARARRTSCRTRSSPR